MSIVLQGSTSGSITLQEPAIAGSNTISLPAATGTAILSNASGDIQFNSGFGSVATAYGCRAWVNFNGTGTVAIRASGNVSSISDLGVGQYRVNLSNQMPDTNYCINVFSSVETGGSAIPVINQNSYTGNLTTSFAFRLSEATNYLTGQDAVNVYAAVFR